MPTDTMGKYYVRDREDAMAFPELLMCDDFELTYYHCATFPSPKKSTA